MSELSNNILNAMSIVSTKIAEQQKADITSVYVICDTTNAALGEYKVSLSKDGSTAVFPVYKQTTDNYQYEIGDSVYILIPGGNYSEKKFIMGLQSDAEMRETPEEKEVTGPFVTLKTLDTTLAEVPVVLDINGEIFEKPLFDNAIQLSSPIILGNYKKIKLTIELNVNVDSTTPIDLTSGGYLVRLLCHDNTNGGDFSYSLSSDDILGNLYYFKNKYYLFSKEIDILNEHFSISSYQLSLEQKGKIKYLTTPDKKVTGQIKLKSCKVELGSTSAEYQDCIYAYEKDNQNTFTDNTECRIGVKVNDSEKELTSEALKTLTYYEETLKKWLTGAKVYWETLYNGQWVPYSLKAQENFEYQTLKLNNSISNLKIRAYLGFIDGEKIYRWKQKNSNVLTFDNSAKMQYNYTIDIQSNKGTVIEKGNTATLSVNLYQNNQLILFEDEEHKELKGDSAQTDKTIAYSWFKNGEELTEFTKWKLDIASISENVIYSCKVIISDSKTLDTILTLTADCNISVYEVPESAVQYEIVSDYDEIGMALSPSDSNAIQYFPENTITFKIYKIIGSEKTQMDFTNTGMDYRLMNYFEEEENGVWSLLGETVLLGTVSYELLTTQPEDWTTGYSNYYIEVSGGYNEVGTLSEVPAWEENKYYKKNTSNFDKLKIAKEDYSLYQDKKRRIRVDFEKRLSQDSCLTLAEKYIYLVHAASKVLANFEVTAFGFNDLTENGTKGIKFTAAGGMNFYAGDAASESNIITIWSGKANDSSSTGEQVFYVTNEGNAYFKGKIDANSGTIGGWNISNCLYKDIERYEPLSEKPNDWSSDYMYYYIKNNEEYSPIPVGEAPVWESYIYYEKKIGGIGLCPDSSEKDIVFYSGSQHQNKKWAPFQINGAGKIYAKEFYQSIEDNNNKIQQALSIKRNAITWRKDNNSSSFSFENVIQKFGKIVSGIVKETWKENNIISCINKTYKRKTSDSNGNIIEKEESYNGLDFCSGKSPFTFSYYFSYSDTISPFCFKNNEVSSFPLPPVKSNGEHPLLLLSQGDELIKQGDDYENYNGLRIAPKVNNIFSLTYNPSTNVLTAPSLSIKNQHGKAWKSSGGSAITISAASDIDGISQCTFYPFISMQIPNTGLVQSGYSNFNGAFIDSDGKEHRIEVALGLFVDPRKVVNGEITEEGAYIAFQFLDPVYKNHILYKLRGSDDTKRSPLELLHNCIKSVTQNAFFGSEF